MREIKIHNTLTGKLEELVPRDSGRVGIYTCGPTVYARIHIGNARPYVVFALFKRFLEREGYQVTLVENITDVNDKIYDAAKEAGIASTEMADEMTRHYLADTDRLGLGRPDHEPYASENISSIVSLIEDLIAVDYAYESGGDVYFKVRSFGEYGRLSNRSLEQVESQEVGEHKSDPLDFALWKAQKEGEDVAWDSPWGMGRPGWHIECSAMAEEILGVDFDIHGGGSDLVFPHHENEIAQTVAARGKPLARIWMHNGMIQMSDEKMAKSEGNIRGLSEVLDSYGRDVVIMYLATGHYRQPLAFSPERMDEAKASLGRLADFCRKVGESGANGNMCPDWIAGYRDRFFDALADDFNTPRALAEVFDLVTEGNKRLDKSETMLGVEDTLRQMLYCLGHESLLDSDTEPIDKKALALLDKREHARKEGDYEAADIARSEIAALGYELRDTPTGPELIRSR